VLGLINDFEGSADEIDAQTLVLHLDISRTEDPDEDVDYLFGVLRALDANNLTAVLSSDEERSIYVMLDSGKTVVRSRLFISRGESATRQVGLSRQPPRVRAATRRAHRFFPGA
jgi:hypothetical protein